MCGGAWICVQWYIDMHEGVRRYPGVPGGVNWLPLPTVDLVGDNREVEGLF